MKIQLRPIHDQVVVLFGATSGIGLETAMLMVEKGARVVIVGRSQEGLDDALARVRTHAETSQMTRSMGNGGTRREWMQGEMATSGAMPAVDAANIPLTGMTEDQVMAIEADITNWEQVKGVADQVVQRYGRIDTWVNVAAVGEWALFEDTDPEEFRRIIDVNLVGHAHGAMAALPYMKQQDGGALISVASMAGRVPIPYQSAYNASKHGMLGMLDTLRMELKHTDTPVSVTAILPASVNTPLFNKARTKLGVEPEPIPPIYDTKLVAKAIIHAATHPVRELIVGDAGYVINFMRRLAPTLTSNYMGATGFRKQRSNEPKSSQAPDNLHHHISGYNQVEGEFGRREMSFSPLTYLSTHPKVRLGLLSGLIAGLGFLFGMRIVRARAARRRRLDYRVREFGRQVGSFLASIPLLTNLPFFHHRSFSDRVVDALPFVHRKSFLEKIGDSLPDRKDIRRTGKMLTESGEHAVEYVSEHIPSRRRREKFVERVTNKIPDRKDLRKAGKSVKETTVHTYEKVSDRMPSFSKERKEIRERVKDVRERI